jgi:hypothetical protein
MQGVERKNLRTAYISKPEIQDGIEMPLDVNALFGDDERIPNLGQEVGDLCPSISNSDQLLLSDHLPKFLALQCCPGFYPLKKSRSSQLRWRYISQGLILHALSWSFFGPSGLSL